MKVWVGVRVRVRVRVSDLLRGELTSCHNAHKNNILPRHSSHDYRISQSQHDDIYSACHARGSRSVNIMPHIVHAMPEDLAE